MIEVRTAELARCLAERLTEGGFAARVHDARPEIEVGLPRSTKALSELFGALEKSLDPATDGYATIRLEGHSYVFEPARRP